MDGEEFSIASLAKEYSLLVAVLVVGIGLIVYGLWDVVVPQKPVVEIVKGGEQTSEIVVDVAGAVEKPGVYTLLSQSRIGDALVMAGGLSAEADREWVAQTLNLASEMKDGQKVYIPRQSEPSENQKTQIVGVSDESEHQKIGKINLNTASAGELDTLEGIGEARATAIITNRPYASIEELMSKAKISQSVYEKIRDQISVY